MMGRIWLAMKRRVAGTEYRENTAMTKKIDESERVAEQVRGHALSILELMPQHPRGNLQADVVRGERGRERD